MILFCVLYNIGKICNSTSLCSTKVRFAGTFTIPFRNAYHRDFVVFAYVVWNSKWTKSYNMLALIQMLWFPRCQEWMKTELRIYTRFWCNLLKKKILFLFFKTASKTHGVYRAHGLKTMGKALNVFFCLSVFLRALKTHLVWKDLASNIWSHCTLFLFSFSSLK